MPHVKQVLAEVAPTADEYWPAEHAVHNDEPVELAYLPATQVVHDASADVEYFPMPHVKQVLTEVAPTIAE